MNLLFPIFLVLSPIPICAVIFKYFNSRNDLWKGTLFSTIKFKIAGCVATYIPIFFIITFVADPTLINMNLSNEVRSWKFELITPYSKNPGRPIRGSINFTNGPRNLYFVKGYVSTKNNKTVPFLPGGVAIFRDSFVYFTLPIDEKLRNLAVFGSVDSNKNIMNLRVVEASDFNNSELKQYPGSISMKMIYSWERLFIISTVPLIAILGFLKIGPILFNISHKNGENRGIFRSIFKIFQFQLGGATAVYVFISGLLMWIFNDGLPRRLNSDDIKSLNECKSIPQNSVFRLYHSYDGQISTAAEFSGKIRVDCGSADDPMTISAFANEINNENFRNSNDNSCYTQISPGAKGFIWNSRLVGIADGKLISFFQTKEQGDSNPDNGKIESNIDDFKFNMKDYKVKWFFQDFGSGNNVSIYSVNRGELYLQSENSSSLISCKALYRNINDVVGVD